MNTKSELDVAVVGVTGAVGEAMLRLIEERNFPVRNLYALASERSAGSTILYRGKAVRVENLAEFDFSKVHLGLFSAGGSVSAEYAPQAVASGCVVIDNTSHFRRDPEVPLVVPEVNPHVLKEHKGLIANPNCSTIQMVVALKPIYDSVGISRINVATYQAVSGAGRRAIEELAGQTASLLNGKGATCEVMSKQIAFNAIPHIDSFQENGYTREEMKMVWETQKIFGDESIAVNPTTVRIPVFYGHAEAVHIETRKKMTADQARAALEAAEGICVVDERKPGGYPTPATEAADKDPVFVGRIREDISTENGLCLWVVADNIRKGAALNSIQIAELLLPGL